ncbi:dihydrodipicolinate synthase family protein [Humibacter ginsenosidimutans]|uniref:Dihydrodipicolinate synthase family protein n=1 Tax=Humibacter ginsenosidimutans TaxID=2599293 RepID=A0A5B8M6N0_9MICO|nr:dihydrodipicolinate synthase family protein [Humibacter ginsenosidimutans]QDZ16237.1 dihydrodipicolinate synthase family protein [Humibacter ginsenosidimutans]
MTDLLLLAPDGRVRTELLVEHEPMLTPATPLKSRVAYAAAHVIPKPYADNVPGAPADLDWDATLAFRHHVWSQGLGVADAMDTAQRNMGLDAAATRELISRSAKEAESVGGALVVGVNTDHIDDEVISIDAVIDAYLEQLHFTEDAGAGVVLMASRHLARVAESPADYERVYNAVLGKATTPVILHWLGEAFDPVLAGYFGGRDGDLNTATDTLLRIIEENADTVSGVKMSLLDADAEIAVRARLPHTASMYTGDDFNYVDLIRGDGTIADLPDGGRSDARGHYSDALLGAFAAIAPVAARAIRALDAGDPEAYERILRPTEALSRQVFAAPTFYYKTGVAFLSWLNGHQESFTMVGGLHSARSLPHLSEIVRLANASAALERPELAAARWNGLLALNGIVEPTAPPASPPAPEHAEGERLETGTTERTA